MSSVSVLSPPVSAPLLELNGAVVVKGGVRILDDVHLTIRAGEHAALLGPNGSGKSSLIKLITRQYYPLAHPHGEPVLRLFGQERWDVALLRSRLGIVSADQHHAFTGDTATSAITGREVVLSGFFGGIGLARHHHLTGEMHDQAQEALGLMEALPLAQKPMGEMSTGEARRVLIARALAPNPPALLLDEPTTGLDLTTTHRFLETIRRVIAAGKTVLLVTHHTEEIVPEIERVILLRNGSVFRDGSKEQVLTSDALSALFETPIRVQRGAVPGYFEARVLPRQKEFDPS
ncbi:MAG: ATP-binding cassette domain-containing protein [Armatimonadota bacterium]